MKVRSAWDSGSVRSCYKHWLVYSGNNCNICACSQMFINKITVNVEIFALYIFLRNSRFSNIRENICTVKITCMIA